MNRSPRSQVKSLQMGGTMEAAGIEPAQDSLRFSRAREQVTPDPKPVRVEKEPKTLKKTRGFRTSPKHLQDDFRFRVLHEFGGRCILADLHECSEILDPAHLIPKATLRKLGFPETVVFDHRNGVAACRRAHRRSDDGLERFPYELLPPSVFDFARDHGLTYLLDRLYPKKELA